MTAPKDSRLCRYCGSLMHVSEVAFAENPFCKGCFKERLSLAIRERPLLAWVRDGDYIVPVRARVPAGPMPLA